MLDSLKGSVAEWGVLSLVIVIAVSAAVQAWSANRLVALQRSMGEDHEQFQVFFRLSPVESSFGPTFEFRVSNFSDFGIWLEGIHLSFNRTDGAPQMIVQKRLMLHLQVQQGETKTLSNVLKWVFAAQSQAEPIHCEVEAELKVWARGVWHTIKCPRYAAVLSEYSLSDVNELPARQHDQ